jgi:hypothetical protein
MQAMRSEEQKHHKVTSTTLAIVRRTFSGYKFIVVVTIIFWYNTCTFCYCWHLMRQHNIVLIYVFMGLIGRSSPQKKTRSYLRYHLVPSLSAMVVVYS